MQLGMPIKEWEVEPTEIIPESIPDRVPELVPVGGE